MQISLGIAPTKPYFLAGGEPLVEKPSGEADFAPEFVVNR